MDITENYPSLINCLETGQHGLVLDLSTPSGDGPGGIERAFCTGPFSEAIYGRIKTDGDGVVQPVLLVMQRDRYDVTGSLSPINNRGVEAAWQNAFCFYRDRLPAKAPIFFKHQITAKGDLEPFQPLFFCRKTGHWFPPVCPQCGLALTLCRDDALLKKRGLPTYSDSLERFLYCGSCATLSDTSPFFSCDKPAGMPDNVLDASALVAQWKQLLSTFPDDADLPCRGCPDREACYRAESLASGRIVPFRFYPFYMMTMPAPSCPATEFIPLISGAAAASRGAASAAIPPPGAGRFLFQDAERQFLEILYLKLTFLDQVCRQLMPADEQEAIREVDLSLEGIGVDLNPPGTGLPVYWNFNVRILDTVGAFQVSPFAPSMPEAPRLHFIGALWFRTLLANSRQGVGAVYAEVGRVLRQMDSENEIHALPIEPSSPLDVFAGSQIFWTPDQHALDDDWQVHWQRAVHMGFELVRAGLKTGVTWDQGQFLSELDTLRNQIRDEMFSGSPSSSAGKEKAVVAEKMRTVLHGILQKWKAESAFVIGPPGLEADSQADVDETVILTPAAQKPIGLSGNGPPATADRHAMDTTGMPPPGTEWDSDVQETVVFSAAGELPPSQFKPRGVTLPQERDPQWEDDNEKTVIIRTEPAATPPRAVPPDGDMDPTVIISAPSMTGNAEDLPDKMVENSPVPPPPPPGSFEEDLEPTVVINAGIRPDAKKEATPGDDDPAAILAQGASGHQPAPSQGPGIDVLPASAESSAPERSDVDETLEATVIISPSGNPSPAYPSAELPSGPVKAGEAATPVNTQPGDTHSRTEKPSTKRLPSTAAVPSSPPRDAVQSGTGADSRRVAPDEAEDGDEIMEQTIIIRSDVKKE